MRKRIPVKASVAAKKKNKPWSAPFSPQAVSIFHIDISLDTSEEKHPLL